MAVAPRIVIGSRGLLATTDWMISINDKFRRPLIGQRYSVPPPLLYAQIGVLIVGRK